MNIDQLQLINSYSPSFSSPNSELGLRLIQPRHTIVGEGAKDSSGHEIVQPGMIPIGLQIPF